MTQRRASRVTGVIHGFHLGGAERVLAALAAHWRDSGREASIVTVAAPGDDVYELPAGVPRIALGLAAPSRGGLEAASRNATRVRALRRALRGLRPDAVVSFLPEMNVLALLATLGTGIPVVVSERTDPRSAPLGRPWALLRRLLYPRAASVVVQTEAAAPWARAFAPRVAVIPNFVDPSPHRARPGEEGAPRVLLAAGRLDRVKGFDLLLRAFALVAGEAPDWTLTILGEGPERGALEALSGELGLRGRVTMPGFAPDVLERMAAAHAFVLPSRREGFPNALMEAMSCALPVVAFDCPTGPAEIVRHGHDGLLVPPGDVEGLAAALRQVLGSRELRARLGTNALEIASRFSREGILARWNALLPPAR